MAITSSIMKLLGGLPQASQDWNNTDPMLRQYPAQADAAQPQGGNILDALVKAAGARQAAPTQEPDDVVTVNPAKKPQEENPWVRGLMTFMGYQPKGGFNDSDPEYIGNAVRGLLGLDSAQNNVNQMDSEKEAAAVLGDKRDRRAALNAGDVGAIAAVDPVAASQVQGIQTNASNQGFTQAQRDALASGDIDAIAKVNPDAAKALMGVRSAQDATKRDAALRMAQAAQQVAQSSGQDFGKVLGQFATQTPGLFTDQDLQIASQGGFDAVNRALAGSPKPVAALNSDEDTIKYINDDGTVTDTGVSRNQSADIAKLMNAQSARLNALKAKAGKGGDPLSGAQSLSETVQRAIDNLNHQKEVQAGPVVGGDAAKNLMAYLFSTPLGQDVQKGMATPQQALRNEINSIQPLLITAIMDATGLSSTQINSNTELQFYLKAVGDPTADIDSRITALRGLDAKFGLSSPYGKKAAAAAAKNDATPAPAARVQINSDGTTGSTPSATKRVRVVNPDGSVTYK